MLLYTKYLLGSMSLGVKIVLLIQCLYGILEKEIRHKSINYWWVYTGDNDRSILSMLVYHWHNLKTLRKMIQLRYCVRSQTKIFIQESKKTVFENERKLQKRSVTTLKLHV